MTTLVLCKNCGKPLHKESNIEVPCLMWRHASGFYGCNERVPSHSQTYAEPDKQATA